MKTCAKCGQAKEVGEFYSHPNGAGGLMHICKECHKAGVKANREAKAEYYREFDRKRALDAERVAARKAYQEEMAKDPNFLAKTRAAKGKWADKNMVKRRAHVMFRNAVRDKKVVPAGACERCGSDGPIEGHHEDYHRPLDVVWLCTSCHGLRHREINELKRAGHDLSCRGF